MDGGHLKSAIKWICRVARIKNNSSYIHINITDLHDIIECTVVGDVRLDPERWRSDWGNGLNGKIMPRDRRANDGSSTDAWRARCWIVCGIRFVGQLSVGNDLFNVKHPVKRIVRAAIDQHALHRDVSGLDVPMGFLCCDRSDWIRKRDRVHRGQRAVNNLAIDVIVPQNATRMVLADPVLDAPNIENRAVPGN